MGLKVYLPVAVAVFFAATTIADVFARTAISGSSFAAALQDHLANAGAQIVGSLILLSPFVTVALVSAFAERRARSRSIAIIFAVAMLTLLYFYFQGYQGAQHALAEKKWTAAALSVGLLPFITGFPVVLASIGATALAVRFDRRMSD